MKLRGFTLIEMAIFIMVLAVIISTVLFPIMQALPDSSKQFDNYTAVKLAEERMELILANRRLNGYSTLADPCVATPSAANCVAPTGFTVGPAVITTSGSQKNISVTVSGAGNAVLNTLVASY